MDNNGDDLNVLRSIKPINKSPEIKRFFFFLKLLKQISFLLGVQVLDHVKKPIFIRVHINFIKKLKKNCLMKMKDYRQAKMQFFHQ